MGRYLKNTQLEGGSYAIQLPMGSNTVGPDSPVNGQIRYNQDTSKIEFYYNGAWNQVAKIGSVQVLVSTFTGDGTTSLFNPMAQSESDPTAVVVTIGGVYQKPTTHYTVSGNSITFQTPPPLYTGSSPTSIVVLHNLNSTNAV
jgi:hypothetical protein